MFGLELMSIIPILSGSMILLGNTLSLFGKIYQALFAFVIADTGWIYMAVISGNIFGIIATSIGVILSILVILKMYHGLFYKDLHKGKN